MSHSNGLNPTTTPTTPVDVVPDLFGYTLHIEGRKFHIPAEQMADATKALLWWVPLDPDLIDDIETLIFTRKTQLEAQQENGLSAHLEAQNG